MLLIYKSTYYCFFFSCSEEITVFRRFSEAIDFAFVRTSYQLLKITFQKKQKMVVPKDTFLQAWPDEYIYFFKFLKDKASTSSIF